MVEVALITPLLLLLLGGVGDLGRAFYYKIAVTNTAREAAHWATLGPAPTDDQILNLVSTPSQESYGICLASNGPNCSSGNGGLAPGSVVNTPPGSGMTPQQLANPGGGQNLSPGHSYLYIYPDHSGRTSLALGMHWTEVASSNYVVTAPAPGRGGLSAVLREIGGSLYPVSADADASPCYTWTGVTLSQTAFTTGNTPTYTVGPLVATLSGKSGSGAAKNVAHFTVNQVSVPPFQQTWASNATATGEIDPSLASSDTVNMSDTLSASSGTYTYQVQVTSTVTSTGPSCTQAPVTANFKVTIPPGPTPSSSPSASPTASPTASPSAGPTPTPTGGSGPPPLGQQITCMVIYYFTPVTPLGFIPGSAVYIVGTATLQATY